MKKLTDCHAQPCKCVLAMPDAGGLTQMANALHTAGIDDVIVAGNLPSALSAVRRSLPDLLLAHRLLPGLDEGRLRASLDRMHIYKYPSVLFIRPFGLTPAYENEISSRAHPCEIACAIKRAWPQEIRGDMILRARRVLLSMGLSQRRALEYLSVAVACAVNDGAQAARLSERILPEISARFGITPRSALDAMRRMIDRAWTTGDIDKQYAYFGNTIDETRGKPTVSALIATAAELIRLGEDGMLQ